MAKLSSRDVNFEGGTFKRTVTVNTDGDFSINLPPAVVDRLGLESHKVTGKTLGEVESAWRDRLAEYKAAQTSERKVIVYRVNVNAAVDATDPWRHREDIAFAPGIAVAVWAGVFIEHCTQRAGKGPVYKYKPTECELPDEITYAAFRLDLGGRDGEREKHLMEWTPERERFFSRANELLHALAVKLCALTKDPEHFAQLAEQLASVPLLAEKTEEP